MSLNVSEGANKLPLDLSSNGSKKSRSVVRVNAEGWQNNRINVESIVLNSVRGTPPMAFCDLLSPNRAREH